MPSARTLLLALLLLLSASAAADEQRPPLPSSDELDRFISECEQLLARGGGQQAPVKKTPAKAPQPPDKQLTLEQRTDAAFALALELGTKPGGFDKQRGLELFDRLKRYDVPELMTRLHGLLVVDKTQEERRWVAFELGRHYLPRIFALDPGHQGRRVAFHRPLHLAYRRWMTGVARKHKHARDVINERGKFAVQRIEKLKRAGERSESQELAVQLMRCGEEWIVSDMLDIIAGWRTYPQFTRRFAAQVVEHYMGLKINIDKRLFQEINQATAQAKRWLGSCSYCRSVLSQRRR